jgi:hypothetical protein
MKQRHIIEQISIKLAHSDVDPISFFEYYVEMASAYFPTFFEELKREFQLKRLALLHENKID